MVTLKRSAATLPAASLLASKKRYGIVKSLIDPRKRRPRPKPTPIPQALKIIRRQKAQATRKAINDIVAKWEQDTRKLAEQLAGKYGRKVRYFLDLLFQGGVRLTKQQQHTNDFNAFKCVKAHDLRNEGITKTLMEITKEYKPEYLKMSKPDRVNMVKRYHDLKESERKGRNPTAKARAHDVTISIDAIVRILEALSLRVGIDAFLCVVRNRTEDFMEPQWYFSNPAIEKYLALITRSSSFNAREVGLKFQSFSIAGCDVMKLFTTDKERVAALSSEIVDLVKERLDTAAGCVVPRMFYQGFAQQITWHHGVVAANWPVPNFENPSKATKDIRQLTAIRNAIRDDTNHPIFHKMSECEWAEWKDSYRQGVVNGSIVEREREPRSDKGKKRPKKPVQGEDDDDEGRESDSDDGGDDPGNEGSNSKTAKSKSKSKSTSKSKSKSSSQPKSQSKSTPKSPSKAKPAQPKSSKKKKGTFTNNDRAAPAANTASSSAAAAAAPTLSPSPSPPPPRPKPKPKPKKRAKEQPSNDIHPSESQSASSNPQPTPGHQTPLPDSPLHPETQTPDNHPEPRSLQSPSPGNEPQTPRNSPHPANGGAVENLEIDLRAGRGEKRVGEDFGGDGDGPPAKRSRRAPERFADTEHSDIGRGKNRKT
ncbi:hypothetical protein PM082_008651 [Marasmius tenuissimus]|nr:hypothetical protein PM082_008651 [Marasmius tenuissimus]